MNKFLLNFLRLYLLASVCVTTTAIIACFYWYVEEYATAVRLDKVAPQRAAIHRNNALWLGMWGGLYGISGVIAGGFLLQDLRRKD